ncbi:MAG: hypothetical protein IT374_11780 [Polyangiaceae bacterium]|nr:hypothetical protein [Polyangiaceae bacterium]
MALALLVAACVPDAPPRHVEVASQEPAPAASSPPAPQPSATAAASGASVVPPKPGDRTLELLRKPELSPDERVELLGALGMAPGPSQPEDTKLTVERADVDDEPGEEFIVSYEATIAGTTKGVAVVREGAAAPTVRYRWEEANLGMPGELGVVDAGVRLLDAPGAGKKHLAFWRHELAFASDASGMKIQRTTDTWEVASLRGTDRVTHLRLLASTNEDLPPEVELVSLRRAGGQLERLDPGGRVVETWTWDAAAQRYTGKGANGKWWEKDAPRKPKPKGRR